MADVLNEVWGRPAPAALHRRAQGWRAALTDALDAEAGRWFYWLPVAFAAGVGAYFTLPVEPHGGVAVAALMIAAAMRVVCRGELFAFLITSVILACACGFAAAKARTMWAAAPVIEKSVSTTKLSGWAEKWEQISPKRGRLTLLVADVEGLEAHRRPHRVRIAVNATAGPAVGAKVAAPAVLYPPMDPLAPGAYDPARIQWFSSIGAGGFTTGPLTAADALPAPPLKLQALAEIARWRALIAARIALALPADTAPIAQALIVGERAAITDADTEVLRASGLYHVISISGLHMALAAGCLFWTLRFGMALIPALALRAPIKKWAAVAALAGAFVYLLLSGSAVAALRSFLMIAVMLAAVMLDRPAVTLRNVALAALVILVALPESLLEASFQMSFAATAALVAFYERYSGSLAWRAPGPAALRMAWAGAAFLAGSAATSLVAGAAVAPISAYHFHAVASYSVLGNLIGAPIVTLIIMPAAVASLIVMPLGLEAYPLAVMGFGIEMMLAVSRWVAALPGAMVAAPAYPLAALIMFAFGGLWAIIWRGRWRYLGAAPIGLGLAIASTGERPDLVVEREAAFIAVRALDGRLEATSGRKGAAALQYWLRADGDGRKAKDAARGEGFRCDAAACVTSAKGRIVSLAREPAALADDCARVDVLIAPFAVTGPCPRPRIVIDRRALAEGGAHAVYDLGGAMRVDTVAGARGERPWSRRRAWADFIPPVAPIEEPSRRETTPGE
ncbi:MAG: ComEC/Rec2 family competence protein [Hyphomicrobiales bacterium]|nr:ComEC/Rec2 family competence protein [Hyphomicrobiales bacterium]